MVNDDGPDDVDTDYRYVRGVAADDAPVRGESIVVPATPIRGASPETSASLIVQMVDLPAKIQSGGQVTERIV